MDLSDVPLLKGRAEDHWKAAQVLAESQNEWAAVAAFYSCYQLARASFLSDPVFDDLTVLKMAHQDLIPDDRNADKHQVRKGSNQGFGMLDLVHCLYQHVGNTYRTLHRGSVQVRYESGLKAPLTVPNLMDLAYQFREQYMSGNLVHKEAVKMLPPKRNTGH